jgi:hypothetical protein
VNRRGLALPIATVAVALPAYADSGVPMIFVTLPLMIAALIPIVAIETIVLARAMRVRFWPTAGWAALSNVVSTLLGIPLTWGVLVGIQLITGGGYAYDRMNTFRGRVLAVTWQAPWLIPYESELHWMLPAATLVLLVPFFFASYGSEYLVNRRFLATNTEVTVNRATFLANLASYVALVIFVVGWWVFSAHGRPPN